MKKFPGLKIAFFALFVSFLTYAGYSEKFVPKSDLIRSVTGYIRTKYVNAEQIDPKKMFIRSLKELSFNIPPIVIRQTESKDALVVDIRVRDQETRMSFSSLSSIDEVEYAMQKVAQYVKKHIDRKDIDPAEIDQQMLNGVLKSLDPHSTLLTPKVYDSFNTDSRGSFGGIGIYINSVDGQLTVVSLIKGTPADRSGLKSKDKIVRINQISTLNISVNEALEILRGKPGDPVDIYVRRGDDPAEKKIRVVREVIPIKSINSVSYEKDKKRLFYMNLLRFNRTTFDELNRALADADYGLSDFQGFVIDLRGNPGGYLDQAIEIADKFLNSGIIVSTAGFEKKSVYDFEAKSYNSIDRIPIVLISDHQSASASEIFIAALKNNKRAVVIGNDTFGKGSVQTIFNLRNRYGLKLTTSQYLVPDRKSIQIVGVVPDVFLNPLNIAEDNLRITRPEFQTGEGRLEASIVEWSGKKEKPLAQLNYVFKAPETIEKEYINEILPEELDQDFAFKAARDVLFDYSGNEDYDALLKNLLDYSSKENANQEKKLIKELGEYSIRWDKMEVQEAKNKDAELTHSIQVKQKDDQWVSYSGNLKPEQDYRLILEAKNTSDGPLKRVYGIIHSSNNLFDRSQVVFGNLKSGESAKWTVPFSLPAGITDMNFLLNTDLYSSEEKFKTVSIPLQQESFDRPVFDFDIISKRDGQQLNIEVILKNVGNRDSEELVVILKNEEKDGISLEKARENISALKAGEQKNLQFSLQVLKAPEDGNIDLIFGIQDKAFAYNSVSQEFKIPLSEDQEEFENTQPGIQFDPYPLISDASDLQIRGKISDDKAIKDYYVYLNNEKILYQSVESGSESKSTPFNFSIPLKEEMNRLTFVARDSDNLSNRSFLYIRKK